MKLEKMKLERIFFLQVPEDGEVIGIFDDLELAKTKAQEAIEWSDTRTVHIYMVKGNRLELWGGRKVATIVRASKFEMELSNEVLETLEL